MPSCSFFSLISLSVGCFTSSSLCPYSSLSTCSSSWCPAFVTSSASSVSQIRILMVTLISVKCRIQLNNFCFRCHICSQPHFHSARNILHSHCSWRRGAVEISAKDPGENRTECKFTLTDLWLLFFLTFCYFFQAFAFVVLGFIFMIMSITFITVEWMTRGTASGGHWKSTTGFQHLKTKSNTDHKLLNLQPLNQV